MQINANFKSSVGDDWANLRAVWYDLGNRVLKQIFFFP